MDHTPNKHNMNLTNEEKAEVKRKLVHIGVGVFSILLRYLSLPLSLLFAVLAFINNAFILPRVGGKKLYRPSEILKGYPTGILLYPITVFILILIYRNHMYIAAAVWAIMGFGDGGAALFGTLFGKHKLFWNRENPGKELFLTLFSEVRAPAFCAGGHPLVKELRRIHSFTVS